MKNKNSLFGKCNCGKIIPIAVFVFAALPFIALAASTSSGTGGLVPCTNNCSFSDLTGLINGIIKWFLGISASVATVTFAIAGAKILLHPDSDTERTEAKSMFVKTAIGLLIVLCAWLVIHTVILALANPGTNALRFFAK